MRQLFSILGWFWFTILRFILSFSPVEKLYADNESGELMRRYMDHKSRVDQGVLYTAMAFG